MNPWLVRLLAVLWMFPAYPLALAIGWIVGVPIVAVLGTKDVSRKFRADMRSYSWALIPERYASAWQQIKTGVQL